MKYIFRIAIALVAFSLGGCMLSSSDVSVKSLSGTLTGPRVVTFIKPTPYQVDMTVALNEQGFRVKAMPSQQYVTKLEAPGKIGQYNEASARYGLTLMAQPTSLTCAFTSYAIYKFTLVVTDIKSNQIVLVLKQKGSDGPCTSVKPVFPTLAKALSNAWH